MREKIDCTSEEERYMSIANVDDHGNVKFLPAMVNSRAWIPTEEAQDWFGHYPDSVLRFRAIALKRRGRPQHNLSLRRAENERNGSGRLPLKRASMPFKHVAGKRKDIRGTDLPQGFDGALSWSVGPARRRRRAERPGGRPSRMPS